MPPSRPEIADRTFTYEAGVRLLSEQRLREALTEFLGVVADNAAHADASFQVARLLLKTLRFKDSIAWFRHAAVLQPDAAQVWQGRAEAVALGGSEADRRDLLAALKSAPIDPMVRVRLQDRFGSLRKESRPRSGGVPAKVIAGLVADLRSGGAAAVEATAARILRKAPRSAVAACILAEAQAIQNRPEEAIASYQRATKLDPDYAEAYGGAGRVLFNSGRIRDAAEALRPAVILAPDGVPGLTGLGASLSRLGHHQAAIVLLERASRLDRKDARLFVELGDACARHGDHYAAVDAYAHAVALSARSRKVVAVDLRIALADSLEQVRRSADALAELNQILKDEPTHSGALMSKASMLQTRGEFEKAHELFRRVIDRHPANGDAYRRLMVSHKATRDDPIIDEMVDLYERRDVGDEDRMNLGFAIAKALEDTRDDARVFRFLGEANRIADGLSSVSAGQRFAEVSDCREAYGRSDFAAASPAAMNGFAPIFVTGLPRSGTTLVEQIIAAHSDVESGGELGFASYFCRALLSARPGGPSGELDPDVVAGIGRDYTKVIGRQFPGALHVTDKSIYTFEHVGALKLALPNARFVVVRRDPRDNLFSIYKSRFAQGTHGYAYDLEKLARYYDEFERMIALWRERVPGWFHEVSYETLVAHPEEETRRLIAACGLDWEDACLNFHESAGRVQTLSVFQVRQPITSASVKGWRRFEAELKPMIDILRRDGHVAD
ncbi:MAG: tetratricopeptide repeat protein [Boseongicola sp. SB0677_bin_26]|nr:tetratricopeptide repeat protein [Boseongicola sp. SB0665_bin_10]MYG25588.1 tetratricopeptide repeat protein [Boseongicola sp. SB0677_bin_26]